MAIVKMKKMHLFGLKKEKYILLDVLQKLGSAEIIDLKEEEELRDFGREISEIDAKLNKLKFAIELVRPFVKEQNILFTGKPKISKQDLSQLISKEDEYFSVIDKLSEYDRKLSQLKGEEAKVKNSIDFLLPWEKMDIPLQELGETRRAKFVAGSIPARVYNDFISKMREGELPAEAILINEGKDESYILIAYHKDAEDRVEGILKDFSVNIYDFAEFNGTPAEAVAKLKEKLSEIEKSRGKIHEEIKNLSEYLMTFKILYDYYANEKEKRLSYYRAQDTESSFYMQAWVPEPEVEKVEHQLKNASDAIYVDFEDPAEDENFPVLLKNPRIVTPFELVTELYSLPDPRGIDPNIFMAPFYFVFFGMMVSDAGYGLVLSLLSGFAMMKLKISGMARKLVELLFLGGISTFIWGAIFGSWFGDLIKLPPLWLNPLDNPLAVMYLSFALGLIQIYFGIILSAYKNIRNGKMADALMDQGLWLVFLSGLVMFAFPQTAGFAKYIAMAGAIGLVLTQGRTQRSVIKKFTSGLLSLYNVTGYLSDVLSYSRLLALGLATGVIAMVINTMARLVGVNLIGYIFMFVIMAGGHLFNVAVNALGAYVHSSRLQYIEFFSKFYDGGGKPFDPLRVKTNYVDINE
ncbi:V-type ATP synthase subunit I [Thermovenabulum sp.]|uniref:V-type ATP synthase subunit I n=1 Tax=Thermovenabulum sp. TaxID=3100335 RepID=UPI003C7B34B9